MSDNKKIERWMNVEQRSLCYSSSKVSVPLGIIEVLQYRDRDYAHTASSTGERRAGCDIEARRGGEKKRRTIWPVYEYHTAS